MLRVITKKINKLGLAWLVCGAAMLGTAAVGAKSGVPAEAAAVVALSELPPRGATPMH